MTSHVAQIGLAMEELIDRHGDVAQRDSDSGSDGPPPMVHSDSDTEQQDHETTSSSQDEESDAEEDETEQVQEGARWHLRGVIDARREAGVAGAEDE